MRRIAALIALLAAIGGCGAEATPEPSPAPQAGASTGKAFDSKRAFADLEAQVEIGPRPAGSAAGRRTVRLIAARLSAAGLAPVTVQRPWRNVLATIPGRESGTVVVGAHWDTKEGVPALVGANDGASGVAVVLELARTLPRPLPGPSIQLVLFDAEEARGERSFERDGARGSRQYVELASAGGGQGAPPLEEIRAMVLFDLVGDCDLRVPHEANSDPGLYALFADAAERLYGSPEPFTGRIGAIGDDHLPFAEAGVPALDLIDFAYGPGPVPGRYWHTPEDTLDKVCPESLAAVGEPALLAIPAIR